MRIVAALGGNALLRRGEPLDVETQRHNVRLAAAALAPLTHDHELIITHGNGPQVGLLALQAADSSIPAYPLDILGAETEGMIGYLLEQELANALGHDRIATVLTRTLVRADDPAFTQPTKFIGPMFCQADAEKMAEKRGWAIARDGQCWRRVVPPPEPIGVMELGAIKHLIGGRFLVICAGGGGIPVRRTAAGAHEGVEAVVDKDLVAAIVALALGADCLLLLTDVPGVFDAWGSGNARMIRAVHPDELARFAFPAGSMGPKVAAARRFAISGRGAACIGALSDAARIIGGSAGTRVCTDHSSVSFATDTDGAPTPRHHSMDVYEADPATS
ncbi:MAG: carbamate kinase [Pseudomonadota bacterium]